MQQESKQIHTDMVEDNHRRLTAQEKREVKRNSIKARRRRKRVTCFVFAVILILLAATPGYRFLYQPYQARSVYRTMKTLYTQNGSGQMPAEYNKQLGALYDVNSDIGGWLIIPGSDINLPVARTVAHDSVYYVNHLFDGTENPYGTPYYLTDCKTAAPQYNTVIRGGEKLMGELSGYRTVSFYQNAPLLFLDGLENTAIYKVFAVVEVADSEVSRFAEGSFATSGAFHSFVTEMGERSLLYTGITVAENDSLLTVLCDTKTGKLAVIGRAVRENEDYAVDTSSARLQSGGAAEQVAEWTVTPLNAAETPTDAAVSQPEVNQ